MATVASASGNKLLDNNIIKHAMEIKESQNYFGGEQKKTNAVTFNNFYFYT